MMDPNGATPRLVLHREEILGQGCQGTTVYGGSFGEIPVAAKRVLINNQDMMEREANALRECRHPRIVKLHNIVQEDQFLILILERCASSLETYCQGKYGGPVVEASQGIKQMLEGVAYIHHCKYVHRDVKPSNILITYSGDLKIADFGFSKPMTGANTFSISDAGKGTVGWMAPELLRAMEDAENSQNFKLVSVRATPAIDVFPLGCVFYFFLTKGQHPFGYCHARNLNIINGKHNLSVLPAKNAYRSLIKHMIDRAPENRPDLNKVLSGPLFGFNAPSEELLQNKGKFNTLMRSLKNKLILDKTAAKARDTFSPSFSGTIQVKDAHISPQRKSILNASWTAPNLSARHSEPLQAVRENDLPPTNVPTEQTQVFAFPATRPKAHSLSEAQTSAETTAFTSRNKKSNSAKRKLVASECLEGEVRDQLDKMQHSKSMTNLLSSERSQLSSTYSVQSLASSTMSTFGSILFLGEAGDGDKL